MTAVAPPPTEVVTIPPPREIGARLAELLKASHDPDPVVRRKTAVGLATFLVNPDVFTRRKASEALAALGGSAEAVTEQLQEATKDTDSEVQKFAFQALDEIEEVRGGRKLGEMRRTLKLLGEALKAKEPEDRIKALWKISEFGADGNVLGEQVIEAARDKVGAVRDAALETLEKINPKVHAHVFVIFRGEGKMAAMTALGELGSDAAITVPLLLYCNDNPEVWGVKPKDGYQDLFPIIAKIAPKDKRFAAAVLSYIVGPQPKVDVGIEHRFSGVYAYPIKDTKRFQLERRTAGIAQLKVIEATTADKVWALVDAMDDGIGLLDVIKTLEGFGADAKSALPALKKLKTSPDAEIRNTAITAIARIEAAVEKNK
jgi:HEAT repeat protein